MNLLITRQVSPITKENIFDEIILAVFLLKHLSLVQLLQFNNVLFGGSMKLLQNPLVLHERLVSVMLVTLSKK